MKKTITTNLLFAFIFLTCTTYAQKAEHTKKHKNQARVNIEASKIGFITKKLNFTVEQAEKFWPIYNDFVKKKRKLKISLKEIKNKRDTLDQKKNKELIKSLFKIKQDILDLEKANAENLAKVIRHEQIISLIYLDDDFHRMLLKRINKGKNNHHQNKEKRE